GQPDHVVVTVTREGTPVSGATVVFHDSNGTALWAAFTDPSGRVDRLAEDNGMVTVIDPDDGRFLLTITQITVPATLAVPLPLRVEQPPPSTPLHVEAPPQSPLNTVSYQIETACAVFDSDTLPATFAIPPRCAVAGPIPVVLTARGPGFGDAGPVLAVAS